MPVSIAAGDPTDDEAGQLLSLQSSLRDLQEQINGTAGFRGVQNGKLPYGLPNGSLVGRVKQNGDIAMSVSAGGKLTSERTIGTAATAIGLTTTTTGPTTTDLPSSGNFGWHLNSVTGFYSFALNSGGVIVFQDLSTLGGSISAAQHGSLTGAGTFHSFPGISGTITDAQHGALSGGSLHDVATNSVNGFMSAADKAKLTDITTIGTASNIVNGTAHYTNGTKVVGARDTAWTITGGLLSSKVINAYTPGATYAPSDLTDLAKWINAIVYTLQAHGLIG